MSFNITLVGTLFDALIDSSIEIGLKHSQIVWRPFVMTLGIGPTEEMRLTNKPIDVSSPVVC
ncbi:hypothetical protein SAMN05421858_4926 [Haladaptatus litoreus]|uniref:Uncharacterized protein n=1 Tax=Haladaptatus litoreus TaxID=553468 RepID=A0A1N7FBZ1_9EURY|nr:hypothetical protein SAMN05421858_4926 [Haladaptatus litoreus]